MSRLDSPHLPGYHYLYIGDQRQPYHQKTTGLATTHRYFSVRTPVRTWASAPDFEYGMAAMACFCPINIGSLRARHPLLRVASDAVRDRIAYVPGLWLMWGNMIVKPPEASD
jgi:hypothetical protein